MAARSNASPAIPPSSCARSRGRRIDSAKTSSISRSRTTDPLAPIPDECGQLGLRRRLGDAVLQPPDQVEDVIAAILAIGRIQAERQPDLGVVVHHIHARRHDAEHFEPAAVDLDRLSHDGLRQRQDRDEGEGRRAQQAPDRVSKVLAKMIKGHQAAEFLVPTAWND